MITYYELLELVKNGKPPKKVKYEDFVYEYSFGTYLIYLSFFNKKYLSSRITELSMVNKKNIEIIEDYGEPQQEFKEIEKLDLKTSYQSENSAYEDLQKIGIAINKLIENQNKIINILNKTN